MPSAPKRRRQYVKGVGQTVGDAKRTKAPPMEAIGHFLDEDPIGQLVPLR